MNKPEPGDLQVDEADIEASADGTLESTDSTVDEEELSDEELRRREIESDMGEGYDEATDTSPLKRKVYDFMYAPATEFFIFGLIVFSVSMLVVEVAAPTGGKGGGWMGSLIHGEYSGWYFWTDVALSVIFAAEYATKMWLAPKKWRFFRRNIIDLLAILPILRVFRIGRAIRLLRLFRLLRLMRVGRMISHRLETMSAEFHKRTAENMVIAIYMLFSVVFGTVGVLVFEKGAGSGFETLGDGLWWCIVTLTTVGYGDISPTTTGGKVVASILMFIGLSFYALLTSVLSTMLIERTKQEEGAGIDVMGLKDHVIVCGWNQNGERLVKDLQATRPDTEIVILVDREDVRRVMAPNIHYVIADPTTEEGLNKARLKQADVVAVLSDDADGRSKQDADARAILTVLAVEKLNPRVHSIVELVNPDNDFHVKNAGVDEILISESYTGTMLSQAVQYPGLSEVFTDLFDTGKGSQLRQIDVPEEIIGKKFSEASGDFFRGQQGILVGYRRRNNLVMSPEDDIEFQPGDKAVLVRRI